MRRAALLMPLLTLALMCAPLAAQPRPKSNHEQSSTFSAVTEALRKTRFEKYAPDAWQLGAASESVQMLDQTESVPAAYQFWVQGEIEHVELLWWQKGDRLTRIFILMLFYCAAGLENERMSNFPYFGAARYASPEREQRLEEIEFVRAHRSALAAVLIRAFSSARKVTPRYENYAAVAARKDGAPLPKNLDSLFRD